MDVDTLAALFEQAESYKDQGQLMRAIEIYELVLEICPQFEYALYSIGRCYLPEDLENKGPALPLTNEERSLKALGYFKAILRYYKEEAKKSFNPIEEDSRVYWKLGLAQLQLGKLTDAMASFGRVCELAPEDGEGYYFLGRAQLRAEVYEKAAKNFTRTIFIDPAYAWAYGSLAEVHLEKREYDISIQWFKTALAMDNTEPAFANYIGMCKAALGLHNEAREWFKKTLEIDPDLPQVHFNLWLTILRDDSSKSVETAKAAVAHLKKAADMDPYYAYLYADILMTAEQYYQASYYFDIYFQASKTRAGFKYAAEAKRLAAKCREQNRGFTL